MQNFRALGALLPDSLASGGWGLRPHTPQTAPPITNFCQRACLEDVHSTEGRAQEAITSRIRSARKNFKEVLNVICGRSISLKVRDTLCKRYVRSALTCSAECWALKVEDEKKMKTTEMRTL